MNYQRKMTRLACTAISLALLGGCACYQKDEPAPAPAPVAEAPAPAPEPESEPEVRTFTLSAEQLFDVDSSTLRPEGVTSLDAMVTRHMQDSNVRTVTVVGHTDSTASDEYNQALSERRADSVRSYLVEHGVSADKITSIGKGESSPVASNDTADGRQQNRRVEITAELVGGSTP